MSMPAAFASSTGRSGMACRFRLRRWRKPGLAFRFGFRSWRAVATGDLRVGETLWLLSVLVLLMRNTLLLPATAKTRTNKTLFGSESTLPVRSALLPLYGARILGP